MQSSNDCSCQASCNESLVFLETSELQKSMHAIAWITCRPLWPYGIHNPESPKTPMMSGNELWALGSSRGVNIYQSSGNTGVRASFGESHPTETSWWNRRCGVEGIKPVDRGTPSAADAYVISKSRWVEVLRHDNLRSRFERTNELVTTSYDKHDDAYHRWWLYLHIKPLEVVQGWASRFGWFTVLQC